MPDLLIVNPQGETQQLTLSQDECILGRDPKVGLFLDGAKVSRRHARLYCDEGEWWLKDLQSANGVFVDGERVDGPILLEPGVVVTLGEFELSLAPEPLAGEPEQGEDGQEYLLTGLTAPCVQQCVQVQPDGLYVGRSEECGLAIDHPSVSRRHARIVIEDGAVVVQDLGSSNGTFINDFRIERQAAAPGDHVRFGDVAFELGISTPAAVAPLRWLVPLLVAGVAVVLLAGIVTAIIVTRYGGERGSTTISLYEAGLRVGLATAESSFARGALDEAERSFRSVLEQDPINKQALAGLRRIRTWREHELAITAARAALEHNKPTLAVQALAPVNVESPLAATAAQLRNRAQALITDNALTGARAACKRRDWQPCHQQARTVLAALPQAEEVQALAAEAEDGMRAKRQVFSPWRNPNGPPREPVTSLYSDEEIRGAALRYSTGDLDTAINRARSFSSRAGGERLLALLLDLKKAYAACEKSAGADARTEAGLWQAGLDLDAKILPATYPSALRAVLRAGLARQISSLGEAAMNRGAWKEAFTLLKQGLAHVPLDTDLKAGINRLEGRAADMLKDLGTLTGGTACATYDEVLSTTMPDSPAHALAKEQRRNCP